MIFIKQVQFLNNKLLKNFKKYVKIKTTYKKYLGG